MRESLLELDGLRVRRRHFTVKVGRLDFGRGSVVLAGPNGSGKSSLLAALAGLLPSKGRARVLGGEVRSREGQRRIGYLPQDPRGLEHLRVAHALRYAASLLGRRDGSGAEVARDLGIEDLLPERIDRLSGGQRRLAYLALSLVHRPAVVLLDEPTSGIDARHRTRIRAAVRKAAESALVVTASHLPDDVEQLGDRTIVLRGGRVVFDGPSHALKAMGAQRTIVGPVEAALAHLERGE